MERGTPHTMSTVTLPAAGSSGGALVAVPAADTPISVAIGVSFAKAIKWCFASNATAAAAAFASGAFAAYRGDNSQLEIPCVGKPGLLYIEALSEASAVSGGLSWWVIGGRER